jgi:predicted DCC family thiol-disulfide oxidoreductase YuxK
MQTPSETKQIVFYDGVCGICNHYVDFIIRRDRKNLFLFAPLQGETAKIYGLSLESTNSIALKTSDKITLKSTAVLQIISQLGGIWVLVKILYIFPEFLRDFFYRVFADSRYLLKGKKTECRIPDPSERLKFLP